ncbi:hypothetical protein CUJ83_03030 [Methanocella sp. CWC-04]|uniref:Uncharacterized protein n=1 Tax=Methanooceanicella nereidis TaxID=2052831 RepID=A0AAP2W488_9EURY|nr:hypothetical protein [Methanocella sp. CWC-04]MCD1293970.1 hypothetical protein [Methanocella sp. CWC-04]
MREWSELFILSLISFMVMALSCQNVLAMNIGPSMDFSEHVPVNKDALASSLSSINVGEEDDGKTITVNIGETLVANFLEYEYVWNMRPNQDVRIIDNIFMESYPVQHKISMEVLRSTQIYFDKVDKKDNRVLKTIVISLAVENDVKGTKPGNIIDSYHDIGSIFSIPAFSVPSVYRETFSMPSFMEKSIFGIFSFPL